MLTLIFITILFTLSESKGDHWRRLFRASQGENEIPQETVNIEDLKFTLFSKKGSDHDIPFSFQNSSEELQKIFKKELPTKFIVHGWLGSIESIIVRKTGTIFLKKEDYNIVAVDWSDLASWKLYPYSAYSVDEVGIGVANMVDKLVKDNAITLDKLHLIGHSLGAHVMGIAGASVKSGRVPHITGLDPANPGFEYISYESSRLDPSDANFVDVIHTAAGLAGYYGLLGHADFYPNGGTPPQPGCAEFRNPTKIFGCSHGRSYEFYGESIINPKGFRAVQCDSWSSFSNGICANNTVAFMGAYVSPKAKGIYYLETNAEPPYAKG